MLSWLWLVETNWLRAELSALGFEPSNPDSMDQCAVTSEEGAELAEKIGATFFEVSAKSDSQEICEIFEKMAKACVSKLAVVTESTQDRYLPVPELKSSGSSTGCC